MRVGENFPQIMDIIRCHHARNNYATFTFREICRGFNLREYARQGSWAHSIPSVGFGGVESVEAKNEVIDRACHRGQVRF
jgi:hypothetical protein